MHGGVYKPLVLVSQSGRCQSRERSVCESKSFETQNTFDLGKRFQKSVCFAESKWSDASWKVFRREPHSCLSSQVWWARAGIHNTWGSSEHHWQSVQDILISNALVNSIAILKVWLLPIAKTSNTTKGSTNKSQSIFYTSCLPIPPIPLPCYGCILAIISQACNKHEHCMVGSRLHTLSHCSRSRPQFYGSFRDCLGFRNRLGKPLFDLSAQVVSAFCGINIASMKPLLPGRTWGAPVEEKRICFYHSQREPLEGWAWWLGHTFVWSLSGYQTNMILKQYNSPFLFNPRSM